LISDRQLAMDARAGDVSAYAELARRWSGPVLAICRRRLRSVHAAEDSAQETFLRSWQSIATLQSPDRFGAWLLGIAHRVCLDWLKRKQNGQTAFSTLEGRGSEVAVPSDELSAQERAEESEERARLMAEVDRLPDHCRQVVLLYCGTKSKSNTARVRINRTTNCRPN
jgi:RNA polymerase sigma factor (sigma-70 family)